MSNKSKYSFVAIVLILVAILGYHYYAASQAEQQIRALIEEQTAEAGSISVQYSDLDVTPFTGKVRFQDLTIIFGNHIERAKELTVDLSYLDVLGIYIGGTEYGLEHMHSADAFLSNPSYVNKESLRQVAADSLQIRFNGQALDGIRAAITDTVFTENQKLHLNGRRLRLQLPKTSVTNFKAQTFNYTGSIPAGEDSFWEEGTHEVSMDSLTVTPAVSFQNSYGFFIQGFGYATDAIPFQSAGFSSTPQPQPGVLQFTSNLKSELALVSAEGLLTLREPLGNSPLEETTVTVSDFSPSFQKVLANIEKLLSISLPRKDNGIFIRLRGTLSNPVTAQ
ncbi:hypothetical protein [Fodinibius salsisoli]|uniref:Uncharacterized protein n=1 Tax=Fodinibius salsisoli TaxID=2820877 RepID=A0ABT3PRT7_9BACT|nr:hypothetical protein [Fodinibius salsisoli]MCW9708540.1 hypothetical protein [Fodinibius salsisoli]